MPQWTILNLEAEHLNIYGMQLWRWDWTGSIQDINGETLNPGANISASARLDVHASGFWKNKVLLFYGRVSHPNAESY